MNLKWHDEFVALCALFPSEELSEEEWAWQGHLACGDSCRIVFEEHRNLRDNVTPVTTAIASLDSESKPETSSFSLDAAERELMSQLRSGPTDQQSHRHPKTRWQVPASMLAACVLGLVGLIGFHVIRSKEELKTKLAAPIAVEGAPRPAVPANKRAVLRPALQRAQEQVAQLDQQLGSRSTIKFVCGQN